MNKSLYPCSNPSPAQMEFPLVVKAIMIDLDGTLLDTAGDLATAANLMLRELGRAELPIATIQSYIGKGIQNLVKKSLTNSLDGEPDAELFSQAKTYFVNSTLALTQKIVCNIDMVEDKKYEINVMVRTTYLPEQSDEAKDRYVFAYTITIANTGMVAAQLISRHCGLSSR